MGTRMCVTLKRQIVALPARKCVFDACKIVRDFLCVGGKMPETHARYTGVMPCIAEHAVHLPPGKLRLIINHLNRLQGPSSEALHLGHLVPFMFTKYLQVRDEGAALSSPLYVR